MTQKKIDFSKNLPLDANYQISILSDGEISQSNLALVNTIFGHGEVQDRRIIAKLSHYIAAGHLNMAVNLLKIRPDLSNVIKTLLEPVLYRLVGFGEQDKVEIILKLYPEFFFTYAPIKDISGVQPDIDSENVKGITVFQHAIWAGDVRFMCHMMLDCLPENKFGETIRIELLRQCNELMDKGVVYTVNGVEHREKQFSLQTLIMALDNYVENLGHRSLDELIFHWHTDVGVPQNLIPAIVRHHYFNREQPFLSKPNFREQAKLNRTLECEFSDIIGSEKIYCWDDTLVGLGSKFALFGDGGPWIPDTDRGTVSWDWAYSMVVADLAALTSLCDVGIKIDLPVLMRRLQSPIQSLDDDMDFILCNLF